MGLNNISFSPHVIADLYSKVLVERNATSMPVNSDLKYLGKNSRNILIVVNDNNAVYLPEKQLDFLTKVLSACKLGLADVAIVNQSSATPDSSITKHLNSKQVLLFGVQPLEFGLPVNFPAFQVQPFDGSIYLFAPPLNEIEANAELKKKLWSSLQRIFSI